MCDGRSERPPSPRNFQIPLMGWRRRDALMASGFEVLGHSRALQAHWARRLGAYAVDTLLVRVPTWTILSLLGERDVIFLALASGVVFVLYGTAAESLHGKTVGKYAFALEVRPVLGELTVGKAAGRNAPKFFWYLFPL